jgi:hypothetical protein
VKKLSLSNKFKLKILKQIIFIFSLTTVFTAQSQVKVSVKIGTAPNWGPVGYTDVQYYYLPDIEVYYDINSNMFIYLYNGVWIRRTYLPYRCRNYDLYGGYKVVLNHYHGHNPYGQFRNHRHRYGKGYRGRYQRNIGPRPGKVKPPTKPTRQVSKPTPRPMPKPSPRPKQNPPVKLKSPGHHIEKQGHGGRKPAGGHGGKR